MKWLCPIPGGSSPDSVKIKILSKHLLPQFRVREFQQEQVSQQSGYNAGLISHWRIYPWMWVLPTNLAPHWLFRVGAEPHFPYLEQFPTSPPLFLVRTAIDPTKLATCWSLTRPWENNLQMQRSIQSIFIISKQPEVPKTHILD